MIKQIHYYLGLDEITEEYSDNLLIESIKNIAKSCTRTMKRIVMESMEYDYDEGRVNTPARSSYVFKKFGGTWI